MRRGDRGTDVRVGIIGGGQLARMIALAGHPLGISCLCLDPAERPPAAAVARHLRASFDDAAALRTLASEADVVTYEFENVPDASLRIFDRAVAVHPPVGALSIAQDRVFEKEFFARLGIPLPRFFAVDSVDDLERAIAHVGLPAVLKTRRLGYDGKGQAVIESIEQGAYEFANLGAVPCVLEAFVSFDREVAIVGARSFHGEMAFYPLVETHQEKGVLRYATVRNEGRSALARKAESFLQTLLADLGYVGVLALELFVVGDQLLANEMAPRVHNSAHWTERGAVTSQFENHLRAILGWPLGPTHALGEVRFANLIGGVPDREEMLAIGGAHVHLYGKRPAPGRKLGHVTLVGEGADLEVRFSKLRALVDAQILLR